MKLKEKMAKKFAENYFGLATPRRLMRRQSYLAGFEAARELILKETLIWLKDTGVIPKGTGYFAELTEGCIKITGEEEVE